MMHLLHDLSETSDDRKCQSEAVSVAKELKSYKFLVTQCIWYEILFQFNLLSKMMQSNDMELDNCLELRQKVQKFLIHFKADDFINLAIYSCPFLCSSTTEIKTHREYPCMICIYTRKQ